jgi:predicted nucleic acid-binding Zn ribbon protein
MPRTWLGGRVAAPNALDSSTMKMPPPSSCQYCGEPLPPRDDGRPGRYRRYCSASCRTLEYRRRRTNDDGERLAKADPATLAALDALRCLALVEIGVDTLIKAINEAVDAKATLLADLAQRTWKSVGLASGGNQLDRERFLQRMKEFDLTFQGLLTSLEPANRLSAVSALLPDPDLLPSPTEPPTSPGVCRTCMTPLPASTGRGRPRRYCSRRCRDRAFLARKEFEILTDIWERAISQLRQKVSKTKELLSVAQPMVESTAARYRIIVNLRNQNPCRKLFESIDNSNKDDILAELLAVPQFLQFLPDWLRRAKDLAERSADMIHKATPSLQVDPEFVYAKREIRLQTPEGPVTEWYDAVIAASRLLRGTAP